MRQSNTQQLLDLGIRNGAVGPAAGAGTGLLGAKHDSDEQLRADILCHLKQLGLPGDPTCAVESPVTKDKIRSMHSAQRRHLLEREWRILKPKVDRLLMHFADGSEVDPKTIDPELVPVEAGRETGDLFRFATLLWSVPVSRGFGRRMRYLVRDCSNGKLIGLFALGDPVFNLRARDSWVGWTVEDRRERLVNVMDAYVVGAIPPYSELLGGKLVASLIGSAEVNEAFAHRYSETRGIISGVTKRSRLALVTVTSALGRSSLYNRLKLQSGSGKDARVLVEYQRVGQTAGFGHFQLSEELFQRLRQRLTEAGHRYASGHQFGQGPNWRMRVIRAGFELLGIDQHRLRHGISREIYALALAKNWRAFLRGTDELPIFDLSPARDIAAAALQRWVIPRAQRHPEYRGFKRASILCRIESIDV